ncbi:signal peptidase [Thermococcus guaymasensis DSM 11113]|uniref:Signal peptidase n=1 Tax=Thermococcus guaymasensis DSM 11113 TaxID=1432656 RepID=A0A0X1KJS5_9EURY|nr:signal peptidase I [Thermococcus guaymasensis]AJC71524.1 signal peptidase [Thermococcus guaymasensis DSM 11113]
MDEGWKKDVAWFFIAILIVAGINYGLKLVMGTDSPLVIVISGSMEPVFYRGDVVLLKSASPEDIHVGDVIVYNAPSYSYPIIHRVREIKTVNLGGKLEKCFVTWGDNNPVPDWSEYRLYPTPYGGVPCVPYYAVEAKAVMVFPKIGLIPLWIREHL